MKIIVYTNIVYIFAKLHVTTYKLQHNYGTMGN